MNTSASILRNLDFGNEAGDDVEPEELVEYFVEQQAFTKFLDSRRRLLVATARKGVGKSALLKWTAHKVGTKDPDALIISVRGADLVRSNFNLSSDLRNANDYTRDWMIRLCALVNRQLALRLKLALTDDRITLVETAELEGYKSRNMVGCLLDRLQTLLDDGRKTTKLSAKNEIELLKRVKDRQVWIIIDDLDATYQNTEAESLSLATFFSACRYLVQDLKGLFIRASIRTDVWALLRRYDEALDKTSQYVSEILWHQRDFLALLSLRIQASLKQLNISIPPPPPHASIEDVQERLLEIAFVPKMQWGDSRRRASEMQPSLLPPRMVDTYKIIYTLSYERPRWAIQLCKLAQEAALRNRVDRIAKESIDAVWGEYGAKRIEDLVSEHKHQCAQVNELLNAFRGAERLMTRADLFNWIRNRVSEHLEVRIEGKATRHPREIARFLYRLGFIVARSENEDGEYEHYRFDQMPDFRLGRTDEDFSVKWEIHPCYRQALDIQKLNESHRQRFGRLRKRN
jgi:hypothetical protein